MKTGDDYRESLRDGRDVYFAGERVDDVTKHPILGKSVDHVAEGYDHLHVDVAGAVSPLHVLPQSEDELRSHSAVVHDAGMMAHITYTSVMTLVTAASSLPSEYQDRVQGLVGHIRDNDLRATQCITDAKGDRSRRPADQSDPDAYVRVVSRQRDGVVIRGAKLHITGASIGHELLVIPTKAMRPNESEYAIACLVPVSSPGVRIVDVSFAPRTDPRDYPVSGRVHLPDGFVIFDDVFVPFDRVVLDGEAEHATVFAHSLGLWERLYGLSSVAEEAEIMVGLAQLIAEANGVAGIGHIKSKIAEMMIQATMIRASLEAAMSHCQRGAMGAVFPDELFTNAGKHYAVKNYGIMLRNLQDVAGGSVVTAPRSSDLDHPEIGELVRKYMAGTSPSSGEYRARLFHAIRDISADAYGGYKQVARLNGGGGLFAQETVTRKHYDIDAAKRAALEHIGLQAP